ncbi:unnamed protein product, partial [Prorocentrum cordatum]
IDNLNEPHEFDGERQELEVIVAMAEGVLPVSKLQDKFGGGDKDKITFKRGARVHITAGHRSGRAGSVLGAGTAIVRVFLDGADAGRRGVAHDAPRDNVERVPEELRQPRR